MGLRSWWASLLVTGVLCAACGGGSAKGEGEECFATSECEDGLTCDMGSDPHVCRTMQTPVPDASPIPRIDASDTPVVDAGDTPIIDASDTPIIDAPPAPIIDATPPMTDAPPPMTDAPPL